ncbi:DUF6965 family protein [Parafilimonas sp.]|uniref:DUF6965 family protein n=1 Tax=Parafilimonas sp. TaxID=1969739 RepID=UPI0039E58660
MISMEQIEELEAFFRKTTIPKTIKLHGAITYHDVPKFVWENLAMLKDNSLTGLCAAVRFDDLLQLKKALKETNN